MSGIINIEEHNKKIEEIEQKKAAIRDGAKMAESALERTKFEPITKFKLNNSGVFPVIYENKQYSGRSKVGINGHNLTRPGQYGYHECEVPVKELMEFAACIIKAFGPIPQELIDSVKVE